MGRGFAIAWEAGASHGVDFYAQDRDQSWTRRRILTDLSGIDVPYHLVRWDGRLVIGRVVDPSTEVARLQLWLSDPHPLDMVADFNAP